MSRIVIILLGKRKLVAVLFITKTYLYNFDPLTLHFYIVKLEFTQVYVIFLIFAQKHVLWVTNTHNQWFEQKYDKYQSSLSDNFQFLGLQG